MIHERVPVGNDGAFIQTYFQEFSPEIKVSERRPVLVICPGGGYQYCSDREAEPIALAFASRGFHTCVLQYPCGENHHFPEQLCALAHTVAWLRENAERLRADENRIAVAGFSAGGHLAASLGVFWNSPFLAQETGLAPAQMRPDRLVLGYPVISSDEEVASKPSFQSLLGEEPFQDPKERAFVSLEKHVTSDVPPTFLWHTYTDDTVPVENSMYFALALRKAGVPFESHIYSVGAHGLSLANRLTENFSGGGVQRECEGWLELAADWLSR